MRPLALVLTALIVAVLVLPILNALALRAGSWNDLAANGIRGLLHVTHMDSDVRPNRAERRQMKLTGFRLWFARLGDEAGLVTLAQAKLMTTDDLDLQVIDEFRKSSFFLESMPFHDAVSPVGGGATLTYGYQRKVTGASAQFRAINAEYTRTEATKQRVSVDLKVFGGKFGIDRVLAQLARGAEVTFQMLEQIKAAKSLFHDTVINGDSGVDANSFDGLDVALAGSTTELNPTTVTDWSAINTEALAHGAIDVLELFLAKLNGRPDAILVNSQANAKLQSIARRAGYMSESEDAFGNQITRYRGIPIVDLGEKADDSGDPVIPVETRDVDGAGAGGNITGLTDIYAVRFGLDAFHAVSLAGSPPIRQWLPDFSQAGAVKDGEVEMVAAVALKATKAAAVLRNVKVT